MITNFYPGKLFLLGEFNVMESGHSAIITPVNRGMSFSISESSLFHIESDYGNIKSSSLDEFKDIRYVYEALLSIEKYLTFNNIKLKPFKLKIVSNLESKGVKYGFGSSGVVLVGVVETVLNYHGVYLTKLELFKWCVFTQHSMNEVSSGGDLAVAIYKKTILYTRYNIRLLSKLSIESIQEDWEYLDIRCIDVSLEVIVGWTGIPNKTQSSLKKLKQWESECPSEYTLWMEKSNNLVLQFLANIKDANQSLEIIKQYQKQLEILGDLARINIETPLLKELVAIANSNHAVGKISGSGGGDCGLAFLKSTQQVDKHKIIQEWNKRGILYIDIKGEL